ncbi:MAG: DNA primase [Sulfobacillus benefaciens]|uniref:DNA primase n=1 Tax=Sulfobacillus benefaciens TaxID=453960 RepID=A0A2T2XAY6_9FIRM|nr:MAG: DNA primase [Sulfobacillus benefaciens]
MLEHRQLADIQRTWDLIAVPQAVVEVRVLQHGQPPRIGRFTDRDAFSAVIKTADALDDVAGIYITLNPIKKDAPWTGRLNVLRSSKAAKDPDIAYRRWLLVDCDPKRPAKTNATQWEREQAFAKAGEIGRALQQIGWPDPVQAASGNGAHLLYRLDDWPNTVQSTQRVQWILQTLAARFSDDAVDVDCSVFNASRISKVYGTIPKKGQATPDRPWWPAVIAAIPQPLRPLPVDALRWIASWAPSETPRPVRRTPQISAHHQGAGWTRDLGSVLNRLASWGIDILNDGEPMPDGRTKILITCPWQSDHSTDPTPTECAVFWQPSGQLGFHCFHAHCAGRGWKEFRLAVTPSNAIDASIFQVSGGRENGRI